MIRVPAIIIRGETRPGFHCKRVIEDDGIIVTVYVDCGEGVCDYGVVLTPRSLSVEDYEKIKSAEGTAKECTELDRIVECDGIIFAVCWRVVEEAKKALKN